MFEERWELFTDERVPELNERSSKRQFNGNKNGDLILSMQEVINNVRP